jgi:hypothetical protein
MQKKTKEKLLVLIVKEYSTLITLKNKIMLKLNFSKQHKLFSP